MGIDTSDKTALQNARVYYKDVRSQAIVDQCLSLAGVQTLVMTNDPFDEAEWQRWEEATTDIDPRFLPALRLDGLLNQWEQAKPIIRRRGYELGTGWGTEERTSMIRRFLEDAADMIKPVYLAASLPPDFRFEKSSNFCSVRSWLLQACVLPFCEDRGLPLALMIGVKKRLNPDLELAGDGVGTADLSAVENLCLAFPRVKFLVTMLALENQHALMVAGRKFANLVPFGCWWFLNNPTLVGLITRMRLEGLGTSFIFQHSDARVLEQLVYKWPHSLDVLVEVLSERFERLHGTGREVTEAGIQGAVKDLLYNNAARALGLPEI